MANLLATIVKANLKGKFNPGALTGLERFMLTQMTIPDRIPTYLAATNVEPGLIDEKITYTRCPAQRRTARLNRTATVTPSNPAAAAQGQFRTRYWPSRRIISGHYCCAAGVTRLVTSEVSTR